MESGTCFFPKKNNGIGDVFAGPEMSDDRLPAGQPTFSVVIPVYNEADRINSLIGHIRSMAPPDRAEIIVVDGSPDQETAKAVFHPGIRVIGTAPGRGGQMNAGANTAQSPVLLFLHADTRLPPDGFRLIEETLNNNRIVGGAFDLTIDSPRPVFRIIEKVASYRSRMTGIPYGDQAIFIRRDYFSSLGGYKNIPFLEDVDLMRRIRKRGDLILILSSPVLTSARRWEQEGVVRGTVRNWLVVLLFYAGLSPQRLARLYPRH